MFRTPGSVLDKYSCNGFQLHFLVNNYVIDCAAYVTSIVLGNDLVCRLSIKSLDEMRENVSRCGVFLLYKMILGAGFHRAM